MSTRAQIQWLADGHRLHLQDGPIDLIVEAFGAAAEVEAAYRTACERFATILDGTWCWKNCPPTRCRRSQSNSHLPRHVKR